MSQANDSILVSPGTGATVATELINSKEYQAVVTADQTGHLIGSKPFYVYRLNSQVHVAAANTIHWDLFNADAALLVRVLGIYQIPNALTAVTGVGFEWHLFRTTAVGTGGTAQTVVLPDLSQTVLDVDITCRSKPTGGATSGVQLAQYYFWSEETNVTVQLISSIAAAGGGSQMNLVPEFLRPPFSWHGWLLRQNQGVKCVQVTSSAAGNTGWIIAFTVE